jgi:hypothetical protein
MLSLCVPRRPGGGSPWMEMTFVTPAFAGMTGENLNFLPWSAATKQ